MVPGTISTLFARAGSGSLPAALAATGDGSIVRTLVRLAHIATGGVMDTLYTVAELAAKVGAELHGIGSTVVSGVAPLDGIRPDTIIFAEKERDVPAALASSAAAVVASIVPGEVSRPAVLLTPHVRRVFAEICQLLFGGYPGEAVGVHPTAVIDPSARLGTDVAIGPSVAVGPGCRIGARTVLRAGVVLDEGASVGEDCHLFPGAVIGRRCIVGDRTVIHPNAVIGGEGFGFTVGEGPSLKQPQFGRVVVGNDCEIGACATIDRGTLGDTVLGDDVKLDNLVQVGHNCRIGNHVRVSALTGFSGGAVVEDGCLIGGQVGVQNRVTIGQGCLIGGQSGVTHDLPPGSKVWGTPARDLRTVLKEIALVQRLPEIVRRLEGKKGKRGKEGKEGKKG
jgi:UDP-3-O-[3-hydroxymyristoyl] glucosamine N-acyltransferase